MDRYWSKVTPQQRNIAIGTLALLLLVHLLSPSPRLSSSSPLSALSPTELQRSPAALEYWEEELQTDEQVQAFLGELHGQRQATHDEATTTAYQRGARRNDRTHGSGAPVTLYWPEPPYFWDSYFGKGQGEHIKVEGCRIECTLVSARANETARQKDSHVIVNYNVWRGTIDGLPEKGPRTLEPWQKAALYSMEPTTYTPWHQDRLKVCSILSRCNVSRR